MSEKPDFVSTINPAYAADGPVIDLGQKEVVRGVWGMLTKALR